MTSTNVLLALGLGLALYLSFRVVFALSVRALRSVFAPLTVQVIANPFGLGLLTATFLLWLRIAAAQTETSAVLATGATEVLKLAALWLGAHVTSLLVARLYFEGVRGVPLPNVVRRVLASVLFVAGVLVLLQARFGWSAGDLVLLTSLVGLSAGVVFQSALGELLASVALGLSNTLKVGDHVRIGDAEGWIEEIEARSTLLRGVDGGHVVMANRKLIENSVTNYSRPPRLHPVRFTIRASASAPPNAVRASLGRCASLAPGVQVDPAPEVLQVGSDDESVPYAVTVWIADYARRHAVEDRVRTLAWYQLRRDGHAWPPGASPELDRASVGRLLAAVPVLAPLTPAEIATLSQRVQSLVFGAGEPIFRQGDAGGSMYVLRSGSVRLSLHVPSTGGETDIATLSQGVAFGERSLLTGDPRSANCTAVDDCELLRIDADSFRGIVMSNPEIVEKLSDIVAEQNVRDRELRSEHERLSAVHLAGERQTVFERIRRFLT